MPRPPKRPLGLTADNASRPPAKSPRLGPSSSSRQLSSSFSQPSSSQQIPYSQTAGYEEPEIIDLTQADDGPARELYGSFGMSHPLTLLDTPLTSTEDGKVVGVQYYRGYASPGEVVMCHREPQNQVCQSPTRFESAY